MIGLAKLVGQLEAMVEDSGDPTDVDHHAWMARWLTGPLPALGGIRPADLIDTMEGLGLVCSALARLPKRRLRLSRTAWRIATDTPAYQADDLNPAHPGTARITAAKRRKWLYDPRLAKPVPVRPSHA